jgi:cell division protein FtsB
MTMETWVTIGGIVVQTTLFLLGGYAMVLRNDWSTKALKAELEAMQDQLKKLAEVITIQAVQTTRIDNLASQVTQMDRRVEDLRRGNGYITGRTSVDGEYP